MFYAKTRLQALILQIKQNGEPLFLKNILPAEKKEEIDPLNQSWEFDILHLLVRKTKLGLAIMCLKMKCVKLCKVKKLLFLSKVTQVKAIFLKLHFRHKLSQLKQ